MGQAEGMGCHDEFGSEGHPLFREPSGRVKVEERGSMKKKQTRLNEGDSAKAESSELKQHLGEREIFGTKLN